MKSNSRGNINQNYQRNLIMATASGNIGINNHDRLVKAYGSTANRIELLIKLKKQSKFTLVWYCIFIVLGLLCLILDPNSWFNVLDLFVVMVNIDLVARGKLIGIYVGVAECLLYAFICFKSQLFGEVIKVMAICVPLNIFSIISWTLAMKKQKKEKYTDNNKEEEIVVNKLTKKQYLLYISLLVVMSAASFFILKYIVGQTTALLLGSISLALTIVGKILTAKRYMESYMVFNIGNSICLFMWIQTILQTGFTISDLSMIVYTLACLSNDIYAYGLWKSMYRKVAVNGGVILAMRKVNIKKIIKLRRRFRNLKWNKKVDMEKNS